MVGMMKAGVAVLIAATAGFAQSWETMEYTPHATYQAVNADGSSAYNAGFPVRMVGVVLNNTEDWLDPTPDYDPGVHLWDMGGEAEIVVQALTRSTLPELGVEYYDPTDFGGTFCWMGQNYGNHIMNQDPMFNYTDEEWMDELARLNFFGGTDVTDPIRAGDLVEVRARAGLHYKGKMNVNEQHSNDPTKDFEVVLLYPGFGLPDPAVVQLADLKTTDDEFIFDSTRQTGGERYQSSRIRLSDVYVDSTVTWTSDTTITVTDGLRTLNVYLGLNPSFDGTELFEAGIPFNVIGILDQAASNGTYCTDGYRLLVMNAADFSPVSAATGDWDEDGDVDLQDFAEFQVCLGSQENDCLAVFDMNMDDSVTVEDYPAYEEKLTGPSGAE